MSVQTKFLMCEISEFSFFMEISVKISQRDSPKFNKRSTWMLIWPHQLHELHTMVHFFKQRFTRNLLDKNKDQ